MKWKKPSLILIIGSILIVSLTIFDKNNIGESLVNNDVNGQASESECINDPTFAETF